MSTDPRYHPDVTRRVRRLPNASTEPLADANCLGVAGDEAQGVRVELSLRVSDGRVRAAAFRAYGCPHVLAACSWLVERVVGCGPEELASWDWREVQQALDVPPQKFGRLLTIQDAIRAAVRNWPL
jgi:NifU-like protein involved in Fe-S cluster formation